MGKIKTRFLGDEEVEKKQKKEQKVKAQEKKAKTVTEKPAKKEIIVAEKKPAKLKPKIQRVKGKKYLAAKKSLDRTKKYTLAEAVQLLKKVKFTNFDESVELHLNVDKTGLKGEVQLPNSTGKTVKIKVVDDKVLADIEKGQIDFDILVSHPSFMPKLAKFAKILGPKGLMPNPKAGTISPNPEEVVKKFNKGALRWKTEPKFPLVHQMIGKLSFTEKALVENATVFLQSAGRVHILSAFIKSTMSPSLKVDMEKV